MSVNVDEHNGVAGHKIVLGQFDASCECGAKFTEKDLREWFYQGEEELTQMDRGALMAMEAFVSMSETFKGIEDKLGKIIEQIHWAFPRMPRT